MDSENEEREREREREIEKENKRFHFTKCDRKMDSWICLFVCLFLVIFNSKIFNNNDDDYGDVWLVKGEFVQILMKNIEQTIYILSCNILI